MFCTKCGVETKPEVNFCANCGNQISKSSLSRFNFKQAINSLLSNKSLSIPSSALRFSKKYTYFIVLTFAIGLAIYAFFEYKNTITKLDEYLQYSKQVPTKIMNGYTALKIISFRDMPGFGGGMGREEAQNIASELSDSETSLYNDVKSHFFFKFISNDLLNCASSNHSDNLKQISTLRTYSRSSMIDMQEYSKDLDYIEKSVLSKFECYELFKNEYQQHEIKKEAAHNNEKAVVHAEVATPAVVETPVEEKVTSETSKPEMSMMDRLAKARENRASFADWTDEDLIVDVKILANPKTQADLDALKEQEDLYKNADCGGSGCMLQKSVVDAAKLLRDKKVKNVYEALGIKPPAQESQ